MEFPLGAFISLAVYHGMTNLRLGAEAPVSRVGSDDVLWASPKSSGREVRPSHNKVVVVYVVTIPSLRPPASQGQGRNVVTIHATGPSKSSATSPTYNLHEFGGKEGRRHKKLHPLFRINRYCSAPIIFKVSSELHRISSKTVNLYFRIHKCDSQ